HVHIADRHFTNDVFFAGVVLGVWLTIAFDVREDHLVVRFALPALQIERQARQTKVRELDGLAAKSAQRHRHAAVIEEHERTLAKARWIRNPESGHVKRPTQDA